MVGGLIPQPFVHFPTNALVGTLFVPNFWALLESFREKHLDKLFHRNNKSIDSSTDQSNII